MYIDKNLNKYINLYLFFCKKTINNNISYLKLKEHIVNKLNKEKKEKEKKEKKKNLTFGSTFQRGNFLWWKYQKVGF